MLPARRALISVSDKTGVVDFAKGLVALGVEILSTGGTKRHLENAGVAVTSVASVTGSPEILDGRVKTLHPAIHAGILADRSRSSHLAELTEQGFEPIDLVVVNLYPFQATVERNAPFLETVEMIDIGGPSMLRAAAKNHQGVVVVVDPEDYPQVLAALEEGERTLPEPFRRQLALKAFRHTQTYDTAIANWLEANESESETFPARLGLDLERVLVPRYGENPHQQAAVYRQRNGHGLLGGFECLQGRELSWNNFLDADAARRLVSQFEKPTVAIIKHNNPCGVGQGTTFIEAYERALSCDPVSAFGSIVAVNGEVDGELAETLASLFIEVLIAPGMDGAARQRLAAKKNLRLLIAPLYEPSEDRLQLRAIDGGFLAQTPDTLSLDPATFRCVTEKTPSESEQRALELAWGVVRFVKSNAIVVTNEHQTVGIGAGQMNRLDSCRLALEKAQLSTEGAVAASDAFFPFRDGLDALAAGGIKAVIQPGGSRRDEEVIAAADEQGLSMLFTGHRHFLH